MCYNFVVLSAPWIAVSLETPPPWHTTLFARNNILLRATSLRAPSFGGVRT